MNHKESKISGQIELLNNAMTRVMNQANAEGRSLTNEENGLCNNLEKQIQDLEKQIAPKPRTVQNGLGGQRTNGTVFGSLGEQLKAIHQAGVPGGQTDPRLFNAATGLNETTPSEGGFLLQSDFSTDLLKAIFETGELASRCNKFTIGGNANSIKLPAIDEDDRATGSRWGGTRGYWLDEADEKTASKPKFRKLELTLKKLCCLTYATDEVVADSLVLEKLIRQSFTDELGFQVDDAIINGSGVGQPLGVLNSDALVTVSAETGQDASTFVYENAMKMWSRLLPRSKRRAVWLINQDVEPQLYSMALSVGTGGAPVFLPGGGASSQPYSSLFWPSGHSDRTVLHRWNRWRRDPC